MSETPNSPSEPNNDPLESDIDSQRTTHFNQSNPKHSRNVNNYKLLQRIGTGGMGEVWMAEQEKPVRRRVALKLIKAGIDNEQVVARFEAERQALAMMDHQNIAKVLDAGTTDDGQPYFVMELVNGIPITQYCDQNKLSIDDRLKLFVPVCKAVQHAHQKGIIHRDLKPSNILVTLYDGQPVPKVIDFGLAKALQHQTKLTDKTLFTEFGQVVGTLQYMSPEQAEMNALDIDTRTDVYALGVLLYELLTGSTPIERETLAHQAILKVLESIREQDPPRPSARLSSSGDAIAGISKQRQIEPKRLSEILKGDLDWIAMKALEKDRTRRYETANNFAEDVTRYLIGDPIAARPPSTAYRAQKFVRKNRALVVSAASIGMLLLLATCVSTVFGLLADRARTAARRSEQTAMSERIAADEARTKAEREAARAIQAEGLAEAEANRAKKSEEEAIGTLAYSRFLLSQSRWESNQVLQAKELLASIPPQHRNIEWHLARRQYEGSDMTLYGHTEGVNSVAISLDGTRIASGSRDNTIKLWDAQTGNELMTFKGHSGHIESVAFSPDGTRIVSGSLDKTIKLWDSRKISEPMTLNGHANNVASVVFSPDGTRIASGSWDNTIKLWDSGTGIELLTITPTGFIHSLAFSPDGTQIASGSGDAQVATVKLPDGTQIVEGEGKSSLKLWDARNGIELMTLKGHSSGVDSVAFSPDGSRIVSCSTDDIKLWDTQTGNELMTLKSNIRFVNCVSFSPDGAGIASGSFDSTIKLWDARSGKNLMTLKGHTDCVNGVAFSPDGTRIVSASLDKTIKSWDARTGDSLITLTHTDFFNCVTFSPDNTRIASGSSDETIKLWDVRTHSELMTLTGHAKGVYDVAFSPDSTRVASGSGDAIIKLWDVRNGNELMTLEGHKGIIKSIAFSPDGMLIASGAWDTTIKIWDAQSGIERMTLNGHTAGVNSVAFSPDGSRIASGSEDMTIKLWDIRTGSELKSFKEHSYGVESVAFSPDGNRLASASGENIKLREVHSGRELLMVKGHKGSVMSVAFSPDGTRIASTGSYSIKLWDAHSGNELITLKSDSVNNYSFNCVAFNPQGTRIAASAGTSVVLWDAESRSENITLNGHASEVYCAAISPDGTRIASGAQDSSIKLWDTRTGSELMTLDGHTESVASIAFSPDGSRIASASNDSTIKLWEARTGSMLKTLSGINGFVNRLAFSRDGRTLNGETFDYNSGDVLERFNWNAYTGVKIESTENWPEVTDNRKSSDGRWFAHIESSLIELVDLSFAQSEDVQAYRKAKVRFDPLWHEGQATDSEMRKDWFAAAFHRAYQLKGTPNQLLPWRALRVALAKLRSKTGPDAEMEVRLPAIIAQSLEIPKGNEIVADDANVINSELWDLVKAPPETISSPSNNPLDSALKELPTLHDLMVLACQQHPDGYRLNTLGVSHYRRGEFEAAVKVLEQSFPMNTRTRGNKTMALPSDTAFLALSFLKLGNKVEAAKYRTMFDEAMKDETDQEDHDNKAFQRELRVAFANEL